MRRNFDPRALLCTASLRVLATILVAPIALLATNSNADVTISTHPTKNMKCSGGTCSPTSSNAVLNNGDLENLLATESVEVTTGSEQIGIVVLAPIAWSTNGTLALGAYG